MPTPADGFASPLAGMARARPHHEALRDGRRSLTYRQWSSASCVWATWLRAQGVRPGDTIAVMGGGTLEHAVALMALLLVGAVMAPQPMAEPPEALRGRLSATGAKWAWLPREAPVDVTQALKAAGVPVLPRPLDCPPDDAPLVDESLWSLSTPWARLCTSGSTGAPRLVSLSGQQILGNTFAVASRLGSLPADVWLAALPWHHVGGLMVLFRALLLGTALRLCQPFDARAAAALLDGHEISLAPLVPTMLERILDARAAVPMPARVRAIVLGGAPSSQALCDRARALFLPIAPSWGMTETCSQVATRYPFADGEPGDVGPALPGAAIDVLAEGALRVRGLLAGGELLTSDRGHLDANGRVHVHGRMDDVLISGGENVAVEPIEAVLRQHPAVADVAVVGRKDGVWGERPVAFLVATPHAHKAGPLPSQATLVAFCKERLASFQRPVQFVWQPSLPRDALGKLRRRVLQALAAKLPG